jgi:hypothetical protein
VAQVHPQDHIIAPTMNLVTYYHREGLRMVQMIVTPTIFLSSKGYGNPECHSAFVYKIVACGPLNLHILFVTS